MGTLPGNAEHAPDYGFMMRDAHRRPAQAIRPPAIVWHLGVHRPQDYSSSQWYDYVEDHVLAIFVECAKDALAQGGTGKVEISNLHQEPTVVSRELNNSFLDIVLLRNTYRYHNYGVTLVGHSRQGEQSRYETVVIGGEWKGHNYWIRVEAFEEYFGLTVAMQHCVETAQHPGEAGRAVHTRANCKLKAEVGKVVEYINARYKALSAHTPVDRRPDATVREASDALYKGLWRDFAADILDGPFKERPRLVERHRRQTDPKEVEKDIKASIFADFRGLVLTVRSPTPAHENAHLGEGYHVGEAPTPHSTLKERMEGATPCLIGKDINTDNADSANRWVESILPVLISQEYSTDRAPRKPPFEPTEYTFSTFGDRRYIYGSGFGPQLEVPGPGPKSGSPLTYALLCFHDEWRQVGRAVLRLHTLGMLRLAALFELQKLMQRDEVLLTLERELQEFDRVVSGDWLRRRRKQAAGELHSHLQELLRQAPKSMEDARGLIGEIKRFIVDAPEDSGPRLVIPYYKLTPSHNRHLVLKLNKSLVALKNQLKDAPPDEVQHPRETLRLTRAAIRCADIYCNSRTRSEFRGTLLAQVRKALAGMDAGVRDGGISYRAYRSRYAREIFDSLAKAMRIGRVRGYQPYDIFVRHRLERAWGLMQAVDARFRQISNIERLHRERLDNEKMVGHQDTLRKLQKSAEIAFWFVLAPYYVSHTLGSLYAAYVGRSHGLSEDSIEGIVIVSTLLFAGLMYGLPALGRVVTRWLKD